MSFKLSRSLGLLLLGSGFFTSFTANTGISLVLTAAPPLREVIVEPAGYTRCYIVPQGFYRGIWHYRHRICEYASEGDLRVWISGYWQCVNYLANGRCMRTAWVESHWAVPVDREYQIAYQRYPGNYHRRHRSFDVAELPYEGSIGIEHVRQLPIHRRPEVYVHPRAHEEHIEILRHQYGRR